MNGSSKRLSHFINTLLISTLITSIQGCSEGTLNLGGDMIHTSTYTALVDTVSFTLSTIKKDSVVTSGTSTALIGSYHNPELGQLEAVTYFEMNYPANFNWDKKEVFDSITLVLHPNGYSLGDTLVPLALYVNQLAEEIKMEDGSSQYNTSSFSYHKEDTIGHLVKQIRPSCDQPIEFRLCDNFGQKIIQYIEANEDAVNISSLYKEHFKGIRIQSDTALSHSICGFSVSDTASFMKIYSHRTLYEKEEINRELPFNTNTNQFNQIINHNNTSTYAQIDHPKAQLSEYVNDGKALINACTGYSIRIDFPFLNNLMELKQQGRIVRADLFLKPVKGTYKMNELPASFNIAYIDKNNNTGDQLITYDGQPLTGSLIETDDINLETVFYQVDLTSYLNEKISQTLIPPNEGISLELPSNLSNNTLDYLILSGQSNQTNQSELLIYYYKYDLQ
jgi:hypothetical protein